MLVIGLQNIILHKSRVGIETIPTMMKIKCFLKLKYYHLTIL